MIEMGDVDGVVYMGWGSSGGYGWVVGDMT